MIKIVVNYDSLLIRCSKHACVSALRAFTKKLQMSSILDDLSLPHHDNLVGISGAGCVPTRDHNWRDSAEAFPYFLESIQNDGFVHTIKLACYIVYN